MVVTSEGDTPASGASALLERKADIERLQAVVDAIPYGRTGLTLVEGDAGIGKSRLLAAGSRYASSAGMVVLKAKGNELEQTFSFGVVLQLLDPVVRKATASEQASLFEGAAGLVRHLFEGASEEASSPETGEEFSTLYGLYWLMAGLTEKSAILVVVDDLQWVDRPSWRFLEFLASRLEGLRIGVLVGTRPLEPRQQAEFMVNVGLVIRPRPLSPDAVAELLHRRLNVAEVLLASACWEATGGIPFYVHALLDEISAQPKLPSPDAVAELSPPAVSLALLRRLAALPSPATAVAHALAVLGDRASREHIARLAGLNGNEVSKAAHALARANILAAEEQLSYIHPIVRSAVYTDIPRDERERLHTLAAEVLWCAGASSAEIVAQILSAPAGSVREASEALETAAREALRRGAPEVAAVQLRRALDEPMAADRRAMLIVLLAHASAQACQPEADEYLQRAIAVAPTSTQYVEIALELARLRTARGRSNEAIAALLACAQRCAPDEQGLLRRLRAEILAIGDIDLTARHVALTAMEALPAIRPGSDDDTVTAMLLAHEAADATMQCLPADSATGPALRALAGEALIPAGIAGLQLSFLAAYMLSCADRFAEAEDFFTRVLEASRQGGSITGFASASAWRGGVAYRRGDLSAAEADVRAGLDAARANGLQLVELTAVSLLCWTLIDRGLPHAAMHELDQMAANPWTLPTFQAASALAARGRVRIAIGQHRAGIDDLTEAGRRITSTGMDNPAAFSWRSDQASGLMQLGRKTEALDLVQQEVALARRWGAPRALGLALRIEGTLSEEPVRLERLHEAVDVLKNSPAVLERARALIELGSELRRRGKRREARPLLHEGAEVAQSCGATGEATRARAELRAAGGRARAPMRSGIDDLTPSEHRLASMAATGRTNRQIAQDLFITTKTVEMHLSAAYRKLGISSRTELTHALNGGEGQRNV